jgi:signal transduction histidine kinase
MVGPRFAMTRKHAPSERERTDLSLRDERRKTDDELAEHGLRLRKDADEVLAVARQHADEVLARARSAADKKLDEGRADLGERARVNDERRLDDEVLRRERASADEELLDDHEKRRLLLNALLAVERSRTDDHLLIERSRMDEMIASRDEFLAIVSHDLRNLLGSIAMSVAALLRIEGDAVVRDRIGREANRIRRHTALMTRLVGDLLDVVSIEAGRLAVAPERHDAMDLVRETMEVFRPLASVKNISIASDVRAGSLLARYDHERILQVLANLVGNAIKFTGEGGRIDLVVEANGDDVRFAVQDNGAGIAPDKLNIIFERFWQVTDQHRTGLGLGLFISKCIVEAHGGRIWAESHPGAGSTFYFTLPAARASTRDLANP